jgi:dTDP-glucose pyrophosphorylase/CBS domain-containing protein
MHDPQILVDGEITLLEAFKLLESSGEGILLFCNEKKIVEGILTDPDMRRLIIKGIELSSMARDHMNRNFVSWMEGEHKENPISYIRRREIHHLPVLDSNRRFVELISLDRYEFDKQTNPVVLMAGGLGTRLRPFTEKCPKPLLELNGKPILEHIIERFLESGFVNFFISVNFLGEMIEEKFGDGSKWGCNITYLKEKEKLGTAGALALLPNRPDNPIIVANGDVLTNVDLRNLLDYHSRHEADATMCVRSYEVQIPFGVVDIADGQIRTIVEKPIEKYYINAGIYCLNSGILDFIQNGESLDMPILIDRIKAGNGSVFGFPIHEDWIDVGRKEDLETARKAFDDEQL